MYLASPDNKEQFDKVGIPVSGTLEDLIQKVDIMLDATSAGVGAKTKSFTRNTVKGNIPRWRKMMLQMCFHGYANYEKGIGNNFKTTSCNTTGLIRTVDCLDRVFGIEKVAITIIRRVADPGDYHRGLTNALKVDKAPNHQAVDLMTIMPHIDARVY